MLKKILLTSALVVTAGFTNAADWTLDNDNSRVQFGSIKKDRVGESHYFERVAGTVSEEGAVSIEIDLTSVQTWVDIRNERMIEHVFGDFATATLTASLDMEVLNAMSIGETAVVDVEGNLSLVGVDTEIFTEMFVARLAEDKVLVTTNDMLFLRTDDSEIEGGIDKLMQLANLPGITRTAPVSLRLVFGKG